MSTHAGRISAPAHDAAGHARGVALALLSATGFGAMGVLAKVAYAHGADVPTLLAGRFTIAALLLWAVVAIRRPSLPPRRVLIAGFLLGACFYGAESGLYFTALTRLDASMVALLLYTYPVLVVAGAVLLRRERADRDRAIALAVAIAGAVLVIAGAGTGALDGLGVTLALATAVMYSTYVLVAEGVTRRVDPLVLAALVTTGAATSTTIFGAATGSLHAVDPTGALVIVALAIVSTVIPITAFLFALPLVGASTASILNTLEPVVACTLAAAAFGEALSPLQLLGGTLVISAVAGLQLRRSRRVRAAAAAAEHATSPDARQGSAHAARGRRLGVRTEVGRIPGDRVRRRGQLRASIAQRAAARTLFP